MSGQPETDDPKAASGAGADTRAEAGHAGGKSEPNQTDTGPTEAEVPGGLGADVLGDEGLSDLALLAKFEKDRLRQDNEIKDLTDRLMRAHAEMDNMRKRTEREKADTAKYALTKFSLDIVTVADNLQRAMEAAGAKDALSDEVQGVYEGIELTADQLTKTLEKHGIRKIEASGSLFDPHLHQAMVEQPNPAVVSGTILQVYQEGYTIGDRVLRPAMVVVARGGPKPARDSDARPAQSQKPEIDMASSADGSQDDRDG